MKLRTTHLIWITIAAGGFGLWLADHSKTTTGLTATDSKSGAKTNDRVVSAPVSPMPVPKVEAANVTPLAPADVKPRLIPAGSVKVPEPSAFAPKEVVEFRQWAKKYFLAEPEQRSKLVDEGKRLADGQRMAVKAMIPENPRLAIENAVPMVVRQDLPPEIVSRLEKRVNTRGSLTMMGILGEGPNPVAKITTFFHEKDAPAGENSVAYLVGNRNNERSLVDTRVNGISVDNLLAVSDLRVRRLEVGERPDPAKPLIESCPISGITTNLAASAATGLSQVTEETVAVEDDAAVTVVCVGGHILSYSESLAFQESQSDATKGFKYAAEGAAGGGISPFNVPSSNAKGDKTLLYVRVMYPDLLQEPRTEAEAYDVVRQTTDFFMESSFGALYLVPTVTPVVMLPHPSQWYIDSRDSSNAANGYSLVFDHALAAAAKLGYDAVYDKIVVDYKGGAHTANGVAFGGLGGGSSVWLYGQTSGSVVGVLAHELGHTFGLLHSNQWLSTSSPPTIIGPGHNVEYGNYYDVMGGATSMGHYVSPHKYKLGWLTNSSVHNVKENGTYRIYQVDQGTADAGKRYALHVNKDSERDYWVEFRQRHNTIPSLKDGVMVTWAAPNPLTGAGWGNNSQPGADNGSNQGAQLLDMTPGSVPLFNVNTRNTPQLTDDTVDTRDDAGLIVGRTFEDPDANVYITPIAKGTTTPPYMDMVVNRGPFPGNRAPTLVVSASSTNIFGNTPVTFTATAADPDGDPLAYSWDFNDPASGTTAAPAAETNYSTNNQRVQSHVFKNPGRYWVKCTVSDMKGMHTVKAVLVSVGGSKTPYIISGRVVDTLGNPMEGVFVTTSTPVTNTNSVTNPTTYHSAYTDSDGNYVITGVPASTGNTTVRAYLFGYGDNSGLTATTTSQFNPFNADQSGVNFEAATATDAITITVNDASMTEGAVDTATITLTRSGNISGNLDVQFLNKSSGTATLGTDYTIAANPTSGAITQVQSGGSNVGTSRVRFAAAVTGPPAVPQVNTVVLTLTATADALSEGTENAVLEFPSTFMNNGTVYPILGPRTITIPITDAQNPTLPVVKLIADDPIAAEGGQSSVMRLERNGATTNSLTVNLSFSGTAVAGADFNALASVVIPAGSSSVTFTIDPIDDVFAEGTESGTVSIAASGSYKADNKSPSATFYITDNDQPQVSITSTASTGDDTATEAGDIGRFTIRRTAVDISKALTVEFSLGGSALSGQDYRRVEGSAIIPAYETSVEILIEPIDDTVSEPDQDVICRLNTNDSYAIVGQGSATVRIINDNDKPEVSIQSLGSNNGNGNSSIQEPGGAPTAMDVFAIDRASPSGSLTVSFTVGGTASSGGDYLPFGNSVSFAPGQTRALVNITINNDAVNEGAETIILTLNNSTGYAIRGPNTATAVITDEATRATVDVSFDDQSFDGSSTATEPDGVRIITITNGGANYTSSPTVTLDFGRGAAATATVAGGALTAIDITNGGTQYILPPKIVLTGGGGSGATAHALTSGDRVTSIAVVAGGTGYTSNPTVQITGGGGTGATATAQRTGGAITSITVTNPGTGYTSAPSISFTGGGGSGASALASITGVTSIVVDNPGTGYVSAPTVSFQSPDGTGATATATIAAAGTTPRGVTAINLTNAGSGYTVAPNVVITGGGGSGATAVADLGRIIRFHIARLFATSSATNVSFVFSGTAQEGVDFVTDPTPLDHTVNIASGSSGAFFNVKLLNDNVLEGLETLTVNLVAGNYSIRTGSATAYIEDSQSFNNVSVGFNTTDTRVAERTGAGGSTVTIPVTLTGNPPSYPVVVEYSVNGGTATGQGVDYTFTNGTLTFTNGGQTTQNLTLVTTPDNVPEGEEYVDISINRIYGADFGANTVHTVTITDVSIPEVFTDPVIGLPTVVAEIAGHLHPNATSVIDHVVLTNSGGNFTSAPTVAITGGGASGGGATATATVLVGGVTSLTLTNGGTGYASAPTVVFSGGGGGTGAAATATIDGGGAVNGITLTSAGSGYTSAPTVGFSGGGGTGATATAIAGGVTGITITNRGTGFTSTPTITISGGGGSGATARAITAPASPLDGVGTVTIVSGGSGYSSGPSVSIAGGGGSGASATATVVGGVVTGITVVKPGSGYNTSPTVAITGGGGSGATATPVINNGAIVGYTVTAGGTGYVTGPVVSFTGGGGAGAEATATVSGGAISGVTITRPGSGYSSPPTVTISGGTGTAAVAEASLSVSLVWFEWGSSATSLANTTEPLNGGAGASQRSFSDTINTLTSLLAYPGTYYYRAVGQNGYGTTKGIVRSTRTVGKPLPVTLKDTAHTSSSITLSGTVNPSRQNVEAWFEWDVTPTGFSFATPHQTVLGLTTAQPVSAVITGLTDGTLIYYRLVVKGDSSLVQDTNVKTAAAVAQQIAGDLLVNVNANQATAGTSAWLNQGVLVGNFVSAGAPTLAPNVLDTGIPGVRLDGVNDHYAGPTITANDAGGSHARSIEAWVLNPGLGSNDEIVSLGRQGALTECSLLYNNDTSHGAIRHDGAANDAGYPAASFPALAKWHHLVYTYNGNKTVKLYVDGALKVTKTLSALLNTSLDSVNIGGVRANGGSFTGGTFSGFVNSMRVHSGELTGTQVTTNFNLGPSVPAPSTPVVATRGASSITTTSATLNAVVVPRGQATTAWIEWGTTTAYDNASAPVSVGSGWAQAPVTLPISALANGVEYHFRVVAQNASGITAGNDAVFTTSSLANAGILWVDLRATDATAGTATWHNRGGLGNFARVGAPALVASASSTGIPGVQFNGTSDAYESFALADADISFNSDRTIELWVLNPTLLVADEGPLSEGRALGARQEFVPLINDIKMWNDNTSQPSWGTPPITNAWHHFVLVHAGTSVLTYLNGVLVNTTAIPSGSDTVDDSVVLGAGRNAAGALTWANNPFDGFINTVRVHGGALSASQISANFAAGPYFVGSGGVLPTAVTLTPPSAITGATATLRGSVTPGAIAATGWIEWGATSGALDKATPIVSLTNSFSSLLLTEPVGGLTSGMVYYYRTAAHNVNGTSYGTEQSFTATGTIAGLPTATTSPATVPIGKKTATLNGTAMPNGIASTAWFEYWIDGLPGVTSTTKTNITAATASKTMTSALSGLKPHTKYWFRLICENSAGKVSGAALTFTTDNTAPVATAGSISIKEDTATKLALKGTDADGETLTIVTAGPAHGVLSDNSLTPTYTPALNYVGTDSFSFTVTDGAASSASVVFNITITAVNDAPLANNGAASGNEDTAINGTATASDPDGTHPVTGFALATPPSSGDVNLNATTGAFTYTPDPDFNGTDSFTFTAKNSIGTSVPAAITITVNPQPDAPEASDSLVGTPVSTAANGQAVATDADGDTLGFALVANASHGNATVSPTGSWSYVPTGAYVGNDSFTFKATDSTMLDSNTATITVIVGGPTANNATFSGVIGDAITGTLTGSDPGMASLTFSLVDDDSAGTVTVSGGGTFIFNPDSNEPGISEFTFKVNNGTLDSPPATVTLYSTPRPPNWTWVGGANAPKKAGVYGTINVPAANNVIGARTSFATISDGTSNTLLFGGSGLGSGTTSGVMNDVWRIDAVTGQWTWRKGASAPNAQGSYGAQGLIAASNTPGGRSDFAYWQGSDGRLWVFGGTGRDSTATGNGLLNDLWVYDPVSNNWTWLKGSTFINANGTYGTRGVSSSTATPGARSGACTWVGADDTLWLFGGNGRGATGTTAGNLNDLWKYDPAANRWTWVAGPSTLDGNGIYDTRGVPNTHSLPGGRSFATAWADVDGKFYLFGGTGKGVTGTTKGNLNDLWSYDPLTGAWTWLLGSSAVNGAASYGTLGVPLATNIPGARVGAAAITDGTSNTLLFGGQATAGAMNDVWRYDSVANQFTWIKGPSTANGAATYGTRDEPAPGNTPGARRGSGGLFQLADGSVRTLFIGGANGTNTNNDLWALENRGTPILRPVNVTGITATDGTSNTLLFTEGLETTVKFAWWPLTSPGSVSFTTEQSFGTDSEYPVSGSITGLTGGTTYVTQAVATNALGTTRSRPVVFTTTGSAAPLTVQFATASSSASEPSGLANISITLSGPADTDYTVPLSFTSTGTAGTDFTAPPAAIIISKGQTGAVLSIPIVNDGIVEANESVSLTLGAGTLALGATTQHVLTITDDDVSPSIMVQPGSLFSAVGSSSTFSVSATGSNLTYQWKKNGANIAGATGSSYTIASTKLTDAGNFTCDVKNSLATVPSGTAELFVVDATNTTKTQTTGNVSFAVSAAGPTGISLAYVWSKDSVPYATDVLPHLSGSATKTLTLTTLAGTDTGTYTCAVSKLGTPGLNHTSGNFVLIVPDTQPILPAQTLPVGVLNVPYSYQVIADTTNQRRTPTSFSATGLPAGLAINATTGVISGKPTAVVTGQAVTIVARNSAVPTTTLNTSITTLALPPEIVGSSVGVADPVAANGNFGARVELTTTATGTYTAKLIFQGSLLSATGSMGVTFNVGNTAVATASTTATFTRIGKPSITMPFVIDAATHAFTGTITDPLVAGVVSFNGWHNKWSATTPATAYANYYTAAFDIPAGSVGDIDIPQGTSYGSFTVAPAGTLTLAGKTADGQTFTVATITGPTGQLPFFAPFTTSPGSLFGTPAINSANGNVTGSLTWTKGPAPATSKDMAYRAGFGPVTLTVAGGILPPIASGGVFFGLDGSDDDAGMLFTEGGLVNGDYDEVDFTIKNSTGTGVVQKVTVLTNPAKLIFTIGLTPVGSFNGSFTVPNPVTTLVRKVSYQGVIVHIAPSTYRSAGYFLMPTLPQPGQTLSTSAVLSGNATLINTVP